MLFCVWWLNGSLVTYEICDCIMNTRLKGKLNCYWEALFGKDFSDMISLFLCDASAGVGTWRNSVPTNTFATLYYLDKALTLVNSCSSVFITNIIKPKNAKMHECKSKWCRKPSLINSWTTLCGPLKLMKEGYNTVCCSVWCLYINKRTSGKGGILLL